MSDLKTCGLCGEPIYDVEEGVRTCGHLDDDPIAWPEDEVRERDRGEGETP